MKMRPVLSTPSVQRGTNCVTGSAAGVRSAQSEAAVADRRHTARYQSCPSRRGAKVGIVVGIVGIVVGIVREVTMPHVTCSLSALCKKVGIVGIVISNLYVARGRAYACAHTYEKRLAYTMPTMPNFLHDAENTRVRWGIVENATMPTLCPTMPKPRKASFSTRSLPLPAPKDCSNGKTEP